MAQDLGLPAVVLDDFMAGRRDLPPDKLQLLAADLFHGHGFYDPLIDRMRVKPQPEPKPLSRPAQDHLRHLPDPQQLTRHHSGPQPLQPGKPQPKAIAPGWAE
jgi:hypothetical protein